MANSLDMSILDQILSTCDGQTEKAVVSLQKLGGFKHVTYHGARLGAKAVDDPFIRSTYEADWIKRYLTRRYMVIDPIIREGFSRTLPFRWDEIQIRGESEAAFFSDAAQFDVGLNGFSCPIRDKDNRRALVSVSTMMAGPAWSYYCRQNIHILLEIAHGLHQLAVREQGYVISHPPLAPREIEVLRWTTRGKTASEIAIILQLRPHTVAAYMRSARYKLNAATIAQAVSKAISTGLISDTFDADQHAAI
ncbi:MAG: LuxR family transcriptional regulator [Ahrensia sp.]